MPVEAPRQLRVLVEGRDERDWQKHYLALVEKAIPDDCATIRLAGHLLSLYGLWGGEYEFEQDLEFFDPNEVASGSETTLDESGILPHVQRPQTLITEDGRIYHDLSLITESTDRILLRQFILGLPRETQDALFSGVR